MIKYVKAAGFDIVDIMTNSVGSGYEYGNEYRGVKIISEKEGFITFEYSHDKGTKVILAKNSIHTIKKSTRS